MIQRNLYDEISLAIYGVISYGRSKCGMSFLVIKLQEEKSYRMSPHVASNFRTKAHLAYTKHSYFTSNVNIYDHSYAKYNFTNDMSHPTYRVVCHGIKMPTR